MIKFSCSSCRKGIGVDAKYAGRLIKCPACQNATRVPAAAEDTAVQRATPVAPTAQAAAAPTMPHVSKGAVNPICPSCNTELFNAADTLCGICGHQLEQASLPSRPAVSIPPAATPVASVAGAGAAPAGLPLNPAIAPYENPELPKAETYDPSSGVTYKKGPTNGRSIGAWFAAVGVGMFLALIWGVIASYFGTGAQMFAWAIGAIVGCLAGLIARNPSMKFCLATTLGALLCMLFGRLVSTWVIMTTISVANAAQDFGNSLLPDTAVSIGVMEQMNIDGELEGAEKDAAEKKMDDFFSGKSVFEFPEYDEAEAPEFELDRKVREVVRKMSSEEKQSILEKVRAAHPEWMEHSWHFEAILNSMVEANEIEDEDLLVHARAKLEALNGFYGDTYYQDTPRQDIESREEKLRELVMKRFTSMSSDERAAAIDEARRKYLAWTPVRHEYLAMLDTMYAAGDIPKELMPVAKSSINLELDQKIDDAFEDYDITEDNADEEGEPRDSKHVQLQKLVNGELLKLEQDEIEKLVSATEEKYPNWTPITSLESGLELFEDMNSNLDDVIARFDSDGTFWSTLKTRFRTLDFVWLGLGMISAFAIVFTLGQSGKEKA